MSKLCYRVICRGILSTSVFYVVADSFAEAEKAAQTGLRDGRRGKRIQSIEFVGECYGAEPIKEKKEC